MRGNESLEANSYQGQEKEASLGPFIEETINTEEGNDGSLQMEQSQVRPRLTNNNKNTRISQAFNKLIDNYGTTSREVQA